VGRDFISAKSNAPDLANFLWLTPIFVFLHGTYQTFRFYNMRLKHFDNIAISRVTEVFSKKCYQLLAGFLGYATTGNLIFSGLFAAISKNLVIFKRTSLTRFGIIDKDEMLVKILAVAKRYRKFPLYYTWGELLIRIPLFLTSLIIIRYFGQDKLGYYSLSLIVLSLPSALIAGSITEALRPRIAMAKHEGKHAELLEKVYARLVALMIFPFMILGLFGNRLFPIVFGSEWLEAGIIAQILVFRVFFATTFSQHLSLVNIMERQELDVILNVTKTIITLASLLLGVYFNNLFLALWVLTIMDSASIIALASYIMWLIDFPFLLTMRKLLKYLVICIVIGVALVLTNKFLDLNSFCLLAIIGTATAIYYTVLLLFDREILRMLTAILVNFVNKDRSIVQTRGQFD